MWVFCSLSWSMFVPKLTETVMETQNASACWVPLRAYAPILGAPLHCIAVSFRSQSLPKRRLMEARMFPTNLVLPSYIALASGPQNNPTCLKILTRVGSFIKKLSFIVEYCALVIISRATKQSASVIYISYKG